ncbi:MAG: pyrroline-5-carboxylate reductase [Planctomycetes bacterium]|nr:pyrroline-5-carboxylate reductase [Planctomycetota bacterium]
MDKTTCGFIGTGRMATALARGFVEAGLLTPAQMLGSDSYPSAADQFKATTGAQIATSNGALVNAAQIIFLAVKPQHMASVLAEIKPHIGNRHLVISVAAGVPLRVLSAGLGSEPRLVRVMSNTPCLVGQGASAYCLGPNATKDDAALVAKLLESVGRAYQLDEGLLDVVTGLSGSGPAYAMLMIEALADGGVRCGLPRAVAQGLAAQTLLGAAQMVLATGEHPGALKDQVASPGGTTIAGLAVLEQRGIRSALIEAVTAATNRSKELGQAAANKS